MYHLRAVCFLQDHLSDFYPQRLSPALLLNCPEEVHMAARSPSTRKQPRKMEEMKRVATEGKATREGDWTGFLAHSTECLQS